LQICFHRIDFFLVLPHLQIVKYSRTMTGGGDTSATDSRTGLAERSTQIDWQTTLRLCPSKPIAYAVIYPTRDQDRRGGQVYPAARD
jgi:hypothetical protein